jgi:hypothetical protein
LEKEDDDQDMFRRKLSFDNAQPLTPGLKILADEKIDVIAERIEAKTAGGNKREVVKLAKFKTLKEKNRDHLGTSIHVKSLLAGCDEPINLNIS